MKQVIIFSNIQDLHTIAVSDKMFKNYGLRPLVLDFSEISRMLTIVAEYESSRICYRFHTGEETVDLGEVKSFWWRRPRPISINPTVTNPEHIRFAMAEWDTLLKGILQSTSCMWVNDINKDRIASHKPYQLAIARRLGIVIPDTLMTNSPEDAKMFWEKHQGKVIFKPFTSSFDIWRETRPLKKEFLSKIDKVKFAPVIFQEFLDSAIDIRITCIGKEMYAGEIQSAAGYQYDWRMSPQVRWKKHNLSESIKESILKFMDVLDLQYGAIDMKLRKDGSYVLLEINPAGQFLFLEYDTGIKISDAMARHLLRGKD